MRTQCFRLEEFCARINSQYHRFKAVIDDLPETAYVGPWLAGGAVRRLTMGEDPIGSDFDYFFRDEAQFEKFCEELVAGGATLNMQNDSNRTYTKHIKNLDQVVMIQAINIAYYEDIEELLNSFDFTLCQFGYFSDNLYTGEFALFDTTRKKLVPATITFATASLRRIVKYTAQGYTLCAGGSAAFLQQVADNPQIIEAGFEYID